MASLEELASDDSTVPLGTTGGSDTAVANDDVFSGLATIQRQKNAVTDRESANIVGGLDRDLTNVRERAKNVGVEAGNLKPWNADEEAAKRTTDPVAAFASWGSVFGILASAFSRAPLENALNASAAAMGAIKQGDAVAYDRAFKAWEENTKQTMDRHKIEHDAYQDATSLLNTNMAAGEAKMRVLSARFDDQKMAFLLDNGLNKEAQDLITARQKATLEFQQAQPKLMLENIKMSDLLGRGYDPKAPAATKSQQALQGWNQVWNGRKYDEDAEFSSKWWAENPDGTSEQFKEAFGSWQEATAKGKAGSARVPKPEEAEINRRKAEKVAAGMLEAQAYNEAVKEVKVAGATLSGNRVDDLSGKINRVENMEATIGKVEELLKKHKMITGLGGAVTRPGEIVGNVFGSNETDRKQFQRYISELQEWAPRALNDSNGRPLSAEVGKINNIVAGLALGDTAANTARAYTELRELLAKIKSDLGTRRGGGMSPVAPAAPPAGQAPWLRDPVVGGGKRSDIGGQQVASLSGDTEGEAFYTDTEDDGTQHEVRPSPAYRGYPDEALEYTGRTRQDLRDKQRSQPRKRLPENVG